MDVPEVQVRAQRRRRDRVSGRRRRSPGHRVRPRHARGAPGGLGAAAVRRSRRRAGASSRVILFDKRGSGLSDRVREVPKLETRMDDIRAVLDAVGVEQAVLWAAQEGRRLAASFAATYPERTTALTFYDPTARGVWAPDYPWARTEDDWRRELREAQPAGVSARISSNGCGRDSSNGADDGAFQRLVRPVHAAEREPERSGGVHSDGDGRRRARCPAGRAGTDPVAHRPARADEARYIAEQDRGRRAASSSPGFVTASAGRIRPQTTSMHRGDASAFSASAGPRPAPTECSRRCCSPTSSARRSGRRSSATGVAAAARAPSRARAPRARRGFVATRSTRPATASSPRLTARPAPIRCALRDPGRGAVARARGPRRRAHGRGASSSTARSCGIAVTRRRARGGARRTRRGARLEHREGSRRRLRHRVRGARRARAEGRSGQVAVVRCHRCLRPTSSTPYEARSAGRTGRSRASAPTSWRGRC